MGNKLSEPIKVGNLTFKNRIMFPPLTTGYDEVSSFNDSAGYVAERIKNCTIFQL